MVPTAIMPDPVTSHPWMLALGAGVSDRTPAQSHMVPLQDRRQHSHPVETLPSGHQGWTDGAFLPQWAAWASSRGVFCTVPGVQSSLTPASRNTHTQHTHNTQATHTHAPRRGAHTLKYTQHRHAHTRTHRGAHTQIHTIQTCTHHTHAHTQHRHAHTTHTHTQGHTTGRSCPGSDNSETARRGD